MKYNNTTISSISYTFSASELFENFNLKKLEVSRKMVKRNYKNGAELRLWCCRIYIYFLYLVILDIIRNSTTFVFTTRKRMILGIEILKGEGLLNHLKTSTNTMYNYFDSEYKYPQIKLFYEKGKKGKVRALTRGVMLNYSLTKEFFDNINSGNKYG